MPRPNRWTDDQLKEAVAESRSLAEVARRLNITVGGGTYECLRRHIVRLRIDATHLPVVAHRNARPRSWTDDDLREAVRTNACVSGVLTALGYRPSGGMHRYIKTQIRRLQLDTTHFTGRSWARGKRLTTAPRRPLEEILVVNSTYLSSGRLRQRLIAAGLKEPRCEICTIAEWRGEPLPLALDHINGDPSDNRLENLRVVCPNCHALTETWCGRKRRPA